MADHVRARLREPSCECHSAGRTPKRASKRFEELRGERDFRHQDQCLTPVADVVGDGLEIDFGLAGAGDAVDQEGGKSAVQRPSFSVCAAAFCVSDNSGRL